MRGGVQCLKNCFLTFVTYGPIQTHFGVSDPTSFIHKAIYDLVTKEHHMRANIANVNIDHKSTRKFRSNLCTHTLSLVLTVKAPALWEGSRQYIWKHLGQNDWKRKNGTSINFVKIHVK